MAGTNEAVSEQYSWLKEVVSFTTFLWREVRSGRASIWNEENSPLERRADRIAAEASLVVLLASRVCASCPSLGHAIEELACELASFARDERHRVLLGRFPESVLSLGGPSIILSHIGARDRAMELLIDRNLDDFFAGRAGELEKTPCHEAHARWLAALAGRSVPEASAEWTGRSLLGAAPHAFYMNPSDRYVLAHTIFFRSDFGAQPLPTGAALDLPRLQTSIDTAIVWALSERNFDVLGELLACAAIVSGGADGATVDSTYAAVAFKSYARVYRQVGLLPNPSDPGAHVALDPLSFALANVHHATMAAGILSATRLYQSEKTARSHAIEAGAEVARVVDWDGARVVERFKQLPHAIGQIVEPPDDDRMRRDSALIDCARRYDLKSLIDHVQSWIADGLAPSPTLRETVVLLGRQTLARDSMARYGFRAESRDPIDPDVATFRVEECARDLAVYLAEEQPNGDR